ncbi:hypothetical protein XthCFBP4691_12235 [Xanthomonas theicola]|uniref:Uncharacterized protein n=1 Tax=Xanthomonas theicola TaxID=56464 RepID=A0A2S6ZE64_9XANT|nr:hypothetical protein XthCFBP4691_12235 [Xanthomonas theicola]
MRQARVIGLSHIHAPQAPAVATGLNIAGFNGGIALGSLPGGASLEAASAASPSACAGPNRTDRGKLDSNRT